MKVAGARRSLSTTTPLPLLRQKSARCASPGPPAPCPAKFCSSREGPCPWHCAAGSVALPTAPGGAAAAPAASLLLLQLPCVSEASPRAKHCILRAEPALVLCLYWCSAPIQGCAVHQKGRGAASAAAPLLTSSFHLKLFTSLVPVANDKLNP